MKSAKLQLDSVRTSRIGSYGKKLFKPLNLKINYFNIKKLTGVVWRIFRFFLLVGLGFILLYPLLYMITISIRPVHEIYDPSVVWIPKHFTMNNFQTVWKAMDYPAPLYNTLSICIVSALIQVITCAVVGYGFARFKFKGKNILFALLIFTIIIPPSTLAIPTMVQFKNFDFFGINWLIGKITGGPTSMNILNTRFVFYVPSLLGMGLKSGLFIYVYNQFFRGLPKELEDSALIDGCGAFRTFTSIMMPNAKPVLLTVLLFSIVWHWNDFFYSSMYLDQQPTVATALAGLSQSLGKIRGLNIYDPYELVTRMQAGSLIAILPLLLMYIFLQKYFTESIERTGIVG